MQANTLLSASPSQASYSLAPYTEFWHEDEQPVTLNDLLSQPRRFEEAQQAEDLNFGYTPHDVWLRTQIHNDSPEAQRWIVQFEYPFLDYVTLYTLRLQGSDVQQSGSAVPVEQRALAHRQAAFPLELAPMKPSRCMPMWLPGQQDAQLSPNSPRGFLRPKRSS
ncbi:hypothetical protein HSBAA_12870 [Vreelandella sulfidaeris]|uniref:7TM-DISM receptor extracellular domain-containing protein n=1 Tax=Vreelandella sulfidaeris TaxID=115553 RepID=A0A455U698_9GAMM|nr:hypothetical protein HSBAA_12870 [Halomonas sulfidaeris]